MTSNQTSHRTSGMPALHVSAADGYVTASKIDRSQSVLFRRYKILSCVQSRLFSSCWSSVKCPTSIGLRTGHNARWFAVEKSIVESFMDRLGNRNFLRFLSFFTYLCIEVLLGCAAPTMKCHNL